MRAFRSPNPFPGSFASSAECTTAAQASGGSLRVGRIQGQEPGGVCYGHVAGGPRGFACTTEVTWLALEWGTHMPSLGRGSLPSEGPQGPLRCHRVLGAFCESLCYTMFLDP